MSDEGRQGGTGMKMTPWNREIVAGIDRRAISISSQRVWESGQ